MDWSTRVTKLLGCQYPIIGGSFAGFGVSALAVPTSEAGGFGLITAGALRTPERFRDDILRARSMTDKPFGVNFTVGLIPHLKEMVQVAIEEKVPVVETSAFHADQIGRRVKEAGIVWIHKTATVGHAIAAEQQGADAVIIVGLEGAGFKNRYQLPTLVAITWAARQIKIPVIAAGGIGDAHGFLAALGMGAEAIYMGTAFMATKECPISERYKQSLVDADPTDPKIRDRAIAPPKAEEFDRIMKLRSSAPLEEWLPKLERVLLKESPDASPSTEGEIEEALRVIGASLAVAFITKVVTVKELIDSIIHGAEEILCSGEFPGIKKAMAKREQ